MLKPKLYTGGDLKGEWQVTLKIDGVRALVKDGVALSRQGKPLHGLSHLPDGDYEIYLGNWEDTITAVRTKDAPPVDMKYVYSLDPIDPRLILDTFVDPTEFDINVCLGSVVGTQLLEGLVLRQGDKWLKVKPFETYDVKVTDIEEGKGKYRNHLGAFITPMGKVGSGLTDKQRKEFWFDADTLTGSTIEVKCMELTKLGAFRHPRFVRVRYDK